jgi:hypothetical protein
MPRDQKDWQLRTRRIENLVRQIAWFLSQWADLAIKVIYQRDGVERLTEMISASRLDWKPCSMFVWIGFPMLLVFFFSMHNGFDQKAQFTDRLGPKEVLRTNFCERVFNYYSWINTRRV